MPQHRAAPFLLMWIAVLLWMTASVSAADPDTWQGQTIKGVNLRQSPSTAAPVITALTAGQTLTVYQKNNGWLQVEVDCEGYGFRGWLYGTYVRELPTPPQAAPPDPEAPAVEAVEAPALAAERQPATGEAAGDSLPTPGAVRPARELARELAGQSLPAAAAEAATASAEQTAPPQAVSLTPPAASSQPVADPMPLDGAPSAAPRWAYLEVALRLTTTLLAAAALLIAMRAFQAARRAEFRCTHGKANFSSTGAAQQRQG